MTSLNQGENSAGDPESREEGVSRLEEERSRKTFNLGDYSAEVAGDEVTIRSKRGSEWGQEIVFDRPRTRVFMSPASRSRLRLLYTVVPAYALAFLQIFVIDGMPTADQLAVLSTALVLLLFPFLIYLLLPAKPFVLCAAVFFVAVFTMPQPWYLQTVFEIAEGTSGEGYVEAFLMGAAFLPIVLHLILSQTVVSNTVKLREGTKVFETEVWGRAGPALVHRIEQRTPAQTGFSLKPIFWFRLPHFFLRLGAERTKSCTYCSQRTLVECNRCHAPVCSAHFELLHGYKVCLDCYATRRGKLREGLGSMNR